MNIKTALQKIPKRIIHTKEEGKQSKPGEFRKE
jgi:hypothetical protein